MIPGISLHIDHLADFITMCEQLDFVPGHVQVNRMPAEAKTVEKSLAASIESMRKYAPPLSFSLHAYKFNLVEKTARILDVWLELARETIQVAQKTGISFVNFHAGYGTGDTRLAHERFRRKLADTLLQLTDMGEQAGVDIHLENLYPRPFRSEYQMLADRVEDFAYFFERIDSSRLKLCYDYGHGNLDQHGIDILRCFYGRLGSVHVHDNDQAGDIHLAALEPGGTIEWTDELAFLDKIGFNGPFITESSEERQIASYRNLRKLQEFKDTLRGNSWTDNM